MFACLFDCLSVFMKVYLFVYFACLLACLLWHRRPRRLVVRTSHFGCDDPGSTPGVVISGAAVHVQGSLRKDLFVCLRCAC